MYLLKKGAYGDFLNILKHTNKQQVGIKSICTEEREKSYDRKKYVFKFWRFEVESPLVVFQMVMNDCMYVTQNTSLSSHLFELFMQFL